MSFNREVIINEIKGRLTRCSPAVRPPFPYLDPDSVRSIFQNLTGLNDFALWPGSSKDQPVSTSSLLNPPLHLLYEAMSPTIDLAVPLILQPDDLKTREHDYARIQGQMQGTHFPDGELNLEILFCGVRGILFYHPAWFSPMIRPLLLTDRLYTLCMEVESLVYVHGPVQRTIFYHQSFGDNQEHSWLPLVPVVIRSLAHTSRPPTALKTD